MASVLDFLGEAMMDGGADLAQKTSSQTVQRIKIERISPDPHQPRRWFDEEKLENLAASIRQMDLLQPILVREEAGQIIIVDGERRWRAAKLAELKDVPVVFSEQVTARVLLAQVVANENREGLADIELAKVIDTIKREYKITGRELGKLLNRSDAQISRLMLLVKNPEIQQLAEEGIITCAEHAALFTALDAQTQAELVAAARDNQTALSYQDLTARKDKLQAVMPTPDLNQHETLDDDGGCKPVHSDLGAAHNSGTESQSALADDGAAVDSINAADCPLRQDQERETVGEENSAKAKGAGSLTLTPAQFSHLFEDNPDFLKTVTSITLKASPAFIAELSDRCSNL
jgi:ParB family chromosome partitioning protein